MSQFRRSNLFLFLAFNSFFSVTISVSFRNRFTLCAWTSNIAWLPLAFRLIRLMWLLTIYGRKKTQHKYDDDIMAVFWAYLSKRMYKTRAPNTAIKIMNFHVRNECDEIHLHFGYMWLCISFPIHSFIHFIICNGFKSIWKLWKQFRFIVTVSMPLLSSLPFSFIVMLCFAFNGMLSLLFCFVWFCYWKCWAQTLEQKPYFPISGLICKATRYGRNIIWHTI